MIAARSFDIDSIKSVFLHPDIFKDISEDGYDKDDFMPNVESDFYIEIRVKDDLIGYYLLHAVNSVTLQIHAQILPKYRKKHALESGEKVLEWFRDSSPSQYIKLVAEVPECFPNVMSFVMSNGFLVEGYSPMSFYKSGILCGRYFYGLSRSEL